MNFAPGNNHSSDFGSSDLNSTQCVLWLRVLQKMSRYSQEKKEVLG